MHGMLLFSKHPLDSFTTSLVTVPANHKTQPRMEGLLSRGYSQVIFVTPCYYRHLWKALFWNANMLPLHGSLSTHCSLLEYFLLCYPSTSFLPIHILNIHVERHALTLFCSSYQENYRFSPDSLLMHNLSGQDPYCIILWNGLDVPMDLECTIHGNGLDVKFCSRQFAGWSLTNQVW